MAENSAIGIVPSFTTCVNVPYEEFQSLTHCAAIFNSLYEVIKDDSIPDYTKLDLARLLFNIKKEA